MKLSQGKPSQLRNRLVEQRVVVGVAVAENEAALPVGHVPVDDAHAPRSTDLADHPLRRVDAVIEDRHVEAFALEEAVDGKRGQQCPLEVTPGDHFPVRLVLQVAGREVSQCTGKRVLADGNAVKAEGSGYRMRQLGGELARLCPISLADERAEGVPGQFERLKQITAGVDAAVAEQLRKLIPQKHGRVRHFGVLGAKARRQQLVAQQRVNLRSAKREGDRQQLSTTVSAENPPTQVATSTF